MEIDNIRKEKIKNENKIKDIDKQIQSLVNENENIRKTLKNTKVVNLQETKELHKGCHQKKCDF